MLPLREISFPSSALCSICGQHVMLFDNKLIAAKEKGDKYVCPHCIEASKSVMIFNLFNRVLIVMEDVQ